MVTMCFILVVDRGWIFSLCPFLNECGQRGAGEGCRGREEAVGGGVVALG